MKWKVVYNVAGVFDVIEEYPAYGAPPVKHNLSFSKAVKLAGDHNALDGDNQEAAPKNWPQRLIVLTQEVDQEFKRLSADNHRLIAIIKRDETPLPCGHPQVCAWQDDVHPCAWCADLEKLEAEKEKQVQMAKKMEPLLASMSRLYWASDFHPESSWGGVLEPCSCRRCIALRDFAAKMDEFTGIKEKIWKILPIALRRPINGPS